MSTDTPHRDDASPHVLKEAAWHCVKAAENANAVALGPLGDSLDDLAAESPSNLWGASDAAQSEQT